MKQNQIIAPLQKINFNPPTTECEGVQKLKFCDAALFLQKKKGGFFGTVVTDFNFKFRVFLQCDSIVLFATPKWNRFCVRQRETEKQRKWASNNTAPNARNEMKKKKHEK